MQEYRHLLIAVNDAPGPLHEGLRLAREERCWATVLKVVPPYEGDLDLTGIRDIDSVLASGDYAEGMSLRDIVYDAGVTARVMVEQGDIAETIIRVAARRECDLIIMGARKNAGTVYRYLNGNLVKRVTEGARCPVMVVDARPEVAEPSVPLSTRKPVPVC
ncbi:universal stress protein family protein [bacterium BMS3Abin01]|nr:universal stress protein family protein [bacterium BMS3Abin01]HDZ59192.1 universal stress protein [Actinomycetota bacterium]